MRPIMTHDIVRIKKGIPGPTGVVNRIDGESANVFISKDNPPGIGVWYNIRELKRIGRLKLSKEQLIEALVQDFINTSPGPSAHLITPLKFRLSIFDTKELGLLYRGIGRT